MIDNAPVNGPLLGIKNVLIFFGVGALTITLILSKKNVLHIIFLYAACIILAILLDELTRLIANFMPRIIALVCVMIILLTVIVLGGLFLEPVISQQVSSLIQSLPKAINSLQSILDNSPVGRQIVPLIKPESLKPLSTNLLSNAEKLFTISFHFLSEVVFVLLVALFLTLNPRLYIDNLVLLFYPSKRKLVRTLISSVNYSIRKWFLGRLLAMLLIGTLTFVSLSIIGIPSSLVLGLIAGVFTIIPFIGAVVSVIPALLAALSTNPGLSLWVIVIFAIAHLMEDITAPLIQQKISSVPPALLVSTQIILVFIDGSLGLLLAEPLCLIAIITVQIVYIREILGEDITILSQKSK